MCGCDMNRISQFHAERASELRTCPQNFQTHWLAHEAFAGSE